MPFWLRFRLVTSCLLCHLTFLAAKIEQSGVRALNLWVRIVSFQAELDFSSSSGSERGRYYQRPLYCAFFLSGPMAETSDCPVPLNEGLQGSLSDI